MNRQELILALEECIGFEESIIPMCSSHLNNQVFFQQFDENKQKEIRGKLSKLCAKAQQHAKIMSELIKIIQQSQEDV